MAIWSRPGPDVDTSLRVAVNVSARHAAAPAIVTDVQAALSTSGIAPEQLELELTETALQHSTAVRAQLARVRSLGVTVAIDDFGTGYTSIAELAHMPADVLKIDRTFITSPDPASRTSSSSSSKPRTPSTSESSPKASKNNAPSRPCANSTATPHRDI
jgi:EAL domain-containing protein (putative c-di-GMP-specific phosphodiesterase class I)